MASSAHSPDNILYTCKKLATQQNYKQSLCKWSGTLHQYIQHIISKHQQSYFVLNDDIDRFEWNLPYLGDQIDMGIFKHRLGYFLYEIVYNQNEGSICFALTCIEKSPPECNNYYGKLILSINGYKEISTCEIKTKPTESLKLIQEESHVIFNNVMQKFIDKDRKLYWYVIIDDNNNEEDVDLTLIN